MVFQPEMSFRPYGNSEMFAATVDFQYMEDEYVVGEDVDGFVGSIRITAEF